MMIKNIRSSWLWLLACRDDHWDGLNTGDKGPWDVGHKRDIPPFSPVQTCLNGGGGAGNAQCF
jgi:hypothetical protein